jgi:hypothetical protein
MALKNITALRMLTAAKLVENQLCNRLGIQVARTVAARCIYNLRPTPQRPFIGGHLRQLQEEGAVVIENFLDPDLFERVRTECLQLISSDDGRISARMHGPTKYEVAVLRRFPEMPLANTQQFFRDPRLVALLEAAEKCRFSEGLSHCSIERVVQGLDTTLGDPETELHSDIFYHTHKAWLYLTDVTPKDAPLVIVRGSHKLTWPQARGIYRHSVDPETPSRRIAASELANAGLREEKLTCKRNTLVIANVCGYHRRSQGEPGGERIALHCSIRTQPFFRFIERFVAPETSPGEKRDM